MFQVGVGTGLIATTAAISKADITMCKFTSATGSTGGTAWQTGDVYFSAAGAFMYFTGAELF
jgi:hypothetical protein